ncbi:hypothetical protein PoMZ_05456 [Pyricularia oryzae]|uniref:Uncharacterized protein n=1 Tax=Pyricularia oryzae TaxID=318829 RepID=A0A4P7NNB3_PYROR|nr:hypothetical protein PoMZ_05456 [Pyricularia oryzae]
MRLMGLTNRWEGINTSQASWDRIQKRANHNDIYKTVLEGRKTKGLARHTAVAWRERWMVDHLRKHLVGGHLGLLYDVSNRQVAMLGTRQIITFNCRNLSLNSISAQSGQISLPKLGGRYFAAPGFVMLVSKDSTKNQTETGTALPVQHLDTNFEEPKWGNLELPNHHEINPARRTIQHNAPSRSNVTTDLSRETRTSQCLPPHPSTSKSTRPRPAASTQHLQHPILTFENL